MRILVHDRPGHPFQVQLSRQLAARGHEVLHSYGSFFQGPKGALTKTAADLGNFHVEGLQIKRPFRKYAFLKRLFQEIEYSTLLANQIKAFRPEVVIFSNTPSEAQAIVYVRCRHLKIRTVFWVQDLYGVAIGKLLRRKFFGLGNLVGRIYLWLDRYLLRRSDQIVLITADFQPLLRQWRIDASKTHVIPNWASMADLPVRPKRNEWAQRHNLADKFCLLYSGTLGMKHNPALLLQLALHFRHHEQIRVVVISEGLGVDWLRQKKEAHELTNLHLFNYQPYAMLADVLGTADVLVAVLEPDAGVFSVPSKVLSYMCAGRPLLLAVPPKNLAARLVAQNQAGLVVHPDNVEAFMAAATRLFESPAACEQYGQNALNYARRHFDLEQITDQFEAVIQMCYGS